MTKAERHGQGLRRLEPEHPPQDDDRACTRCAPARSPTVSTPVTWDEVAAAADGDAELRFLRTDVLERVEELGDLFAPVLTTEQRLPAGG